MKILIIHEIEWFEKVIFEPHHFAEILSLSGNDVFVIDCAIPDFKNLVKGMKTRIIKNSNRVYEGSNVTVIRPPTILVKGLNRIFHFMTCEKVIRDTIKKNKIDIILLYGVATNGKQSIKVSKEMKIPILYRALDISHGLIRIPILKQIVKNYEKFVIQNVDKILTTTPDLARYIHEMGGKKEKIETFPLGVNLKNFKPLKKDLDLCNALGIGKDDLVLVFMGTLYPFSGLENIIKKFINIKNNHPTLKLLIVGGGPSFNKLKKLIREEKLETEIIMTGFVSQHKIPKYIALADICINSFDVNFVTNRILPTKILEYFACGKPVLSTPLSGTKEVLPDETYGIVYSNSNQFVQTISDLLMNSKRLAKLGNNAYIYTKNNHDWNILSNKLEQLFKKLIIKK